MVVMIIEKILGKLTVTEKKVDTVIVDWYERDKKLLRKTTSSGEDIGIKVEQPLNDGDILLKMTAG